MHLSTPDDHCRPEPTVTHTDPVESAQLGGWGGFLVRAFLWAAAGWLVTHALNCACSSAPTAVQSRPSNPPSERDRDGAAPPVPSP